MRFLLLLTIITSASFHSFSQTYWQQKVDYTISVKLDDVKHTLSGYESFVYHNNSPQALDFIYMHLWPNAYSTGKTALGRQLYEDGDGILTFGKDSIRGGIDSLHFKVNGQDAALTFDPKNPDIAKLTLNQSLKPGESITVTTPFRVKIPSGEVSRLGHVGQSYQITQWFPKPAVYDKNGWNQIPYLTQGEFYSEYGTFDVSITLPKNYVVGATGDLQTESEIAFMDEKAAYTKENFQTLLQKENRNNKFPASSSEWKTIRYKQKDVHDFAWFADKRYSVLKGEVELPHSKRKVTTWSLFTPKNAGLWKRAPEYIHDGTYYYSLWNGDYPYNQVTAVDGTISAGGGMEYPNVTVIGNSRTDIELEIVIVHEVGHNWFYGILGSNERVHGWMDEGMNTLNEMRYVYTKYPKNTNLSDQILNGKFHFDHLSHYDSGDFMYRLIAGMGEDQPIETHSADFTGINYAGIMYQKTGLVFNYLKEYLGDSLFDQAMQTYYNEWSFKHPQPEDLRATLERVTGRDLSWLFVDLIQTTNHIDYKVSKVKSFGGKTTVTVKNTGQVDGPIEVSGFREGKKIQTIWVENGTGKSEVTFDSEMDAVQINASGKAPELVQTNNYWHQKGLFGKADPPRLQFLIGKNEPTKNNLFWSPVLGGNAYDKFMLGLALHNFSIPSNRFQFLVAPMYSFGAKRISGIAEMSMSFLPKKSLKLSRFGVSLRSFQNDSVSTNSGYYAAVLPYWTAKIGNRIGGPISQNIRLQTMYRLDVSRPKQRELLGGYLQYDFNFSKEDHRVDLQLRTDYAANPVNSDNFSRSSVSASYKYRYVKNKRDRWIELRLFAGNYWNFDMYNSGNAVNYAFALSGASGSQDLFIEDYFFGRSAQSGIWSQQRLDNMGGFRSTAGNGKSTYFGTTTTWMTAANFYMEMPIGPKIFGVYADFGMFDEAFKSKPTQAYDLGLAIRLGTTFGIYFPVMQSENMEKAYLTKKYAERIRFTLKFNLTDKPVNWVKLLP
ncbi:MAG: M1 family metallopeptidase [Fluviicola sp.]